MNASPFRIRTLVSSRCAAAAFLALSLPLSALESGWYIACRYYCFLHETFIGMKGRKRKESPTRNFFPPPLAETEGVDN